MPTPPVLLPYGFVGIYGFAELPTFGIDNPSLFSGGLPMVFGTIYQVGVGNSLDMVGSSVLFNRDERTAILTWNNYPYTIMPIVKLVCTEDNL